MKFSTVIFILIGVILLLGLFSIFKSMPSLQQQNTKAVTSTITPQDKNKKIFNLQIKDRKITSGGEILKAVQGDQIIINIISDEVEEFHVHAYDKSIILEKNKKAVLTFTANLSGRFPFELENSNTEIGVLEVQPK